MQIKRVKITDLKVAKYNPRKDLKPSDPEYQKLKKSIIEFDYIDPIIWNERTGVVVGGHQRFKILQELGHTEIDVSVVDLDEQKEKALNIALNKINGEWDIPQLTELLSGLDDLDFDMDLTGFGRDEIEGLLGEDLPPDEGIVPKGDPNILIRLSVPPPVWLSKRNEFIVILDKMKKTYLMEYKIEE